MRGRDTRVCQYGFMQKVKRPTFSRKKEMLLTYNAPLQSFMLAVRLRFWGTIVIKPTTLQEVQKRLRPEKSGKKYFYVAVKPL